MLARTHASLSDAILPTLAAWLIAPALARGGEDTTPPELKSLGFTPASIDSSSTAMEVTVNFIVTDDASGANYFETAFLDPSGNGQQSASCRKVQEMAWVRQTENSLETNPGPPFTISRDRFNLN